MNIMKLLQNMKLQKDNFFMLSPCKKICKIKKKVCIGCGRSKEQISNWLKYSNYQRKKIMKELKSFQ